MPLLMPDYMAPALQPDGRILIMALLARDDPATPNVDEQLWEIEYEMPAPWAKDATGADVRTWYTMDGNVLTQHIEPTASTVWPVVADPTAKQNKQAAKARNQAKVAEKQADIAATARKAAQEAQAKAARLAAAAEAKLLAAKNQAKKREELARQAKEKAKAAKEAMELARKQAKAAADAARAAAEAARKANKAAQALATSNAKKLAEKASKAASKATTASNNARISAKAADTAAVSAEQSKVSIVDSLATAKATIKVYEDTTLTVKQKIAKTQPILNHYATRVVERKTTAAKDSSGAAPPSMEPRSLKSPDRSDAELWANVLMEYVVDGRSVGFFTLGGDADTVDVTVRLRNLSSVQLDHPLPFTMTAPVVPGDPDSASRISTSKERYTAISAFTFGEDKGCQSRSGEAAADCVIPRISSNGQTTFGFRLLANPRQTRTGSANLATTRTTIGRTEFIPITLFQNRYQTDFEKDGRVEYLDHTVEVDAAITAIRPEAMTVGIYNAEAASDLLQQAEEIATAQHEALTACGYGQTAEQYLSQWYKQLPNGDWALKIRNAGEGAEYAGTIGQLKYAAIQRAFRDVDNLVNDMAPLRKIANRMAAIGDIVEIGEMGAVYGAISCASLTRVALASLGRVGGIAGLVMSLAAEQFLHLVADGAGRTSSWLAQVRAGAKTGCTRIDWTEGEDGQPYVAFAQNKPYGGAFQFDGSEYPHKDSGQQWSVLCSRATK